MRKSRQVHGVKEAPWRSQGITGPAHLFPLWSLHETQTLHATPTAQPLWNMVWNTVPWAGGVSSVRFESLSAIPTVTRLTAASWACVTGFWVALGTACCLCPLLSGLLSDPSKVAPRHVLTLGSVSERVSMLLHTCLHSTSSTLCLNLLT